MPKLPSYKTADCCLNQECDFLSDNPNEPCWGQVTVVDEIYTDDDWWWVHACEGHSEIGKYTPSINPEDKI